VVRLHVVQRPPDERVEINRRRLGRVAGPPVALGHDGHLAANRADFSRGQTEQFLRRQVGIQIQAHLADVRVAAEGFRQGQPRLQRGAQVAGQAAHGGRGFSDGSVKAGSL